MTLEWFLITRLKLIVGGILSVRNRYIEYPIEEDERLNEQNIMVKSGDYNRKILLYLC